MEFQNQLSFSNSPLSTLGYQQDYSNLFSLSSVPSYGDAFASNMQPMLNNIQFQTGLTLSTASDPLTRMQGQNMANGVMNQLTSTFQPSGATQSSGFKDLFNSQNMGTTFSALGQIGGQVGGTAGNIMTGGSKLGSSINNLVSQSNAAGGFNNLSLTGKTGGVGAVVGAASDLIGSFLPEKTEYSGDKGNVTQTMDTVYDGISDAVMKIPVYGTLIGGAMKGAALIGKGINAIGGGTDGMCVCAGTKVFKANGEIVNIENLKKEDGIIGWSEINRNIVPQLIHDFIKPRQKECVEITLKNGIILRCSFDHPIYNGSDFIPASKLKLHSKVAVSDYPKSNTNIKYVEVVSIKPIGRQIVYNLQADNDHTYLANCIITHNTTQDAILGSSFFNWTPLGMVNGFFGSKANTINKNEETFEQVGSSYTGSNATVDNAVHYSGKKYGLFSRRALNKTNQKIAEANRQQNLITNIAKESQDAATLKATMATVNANRRKFEMQGGYNQGAVRVGKYGMSVELLQKARNIIKAQEGKKLTPIDKYKLMVSKTWENIPETGKPTYEEWIMDLNPDYINEENYDLKTAYDNLGYSLMQRWKFAANRPTKKEQDYYLNYNIDGYYPFHLKSVAPLRTGDFIFLKKGTEKTNKELEGELDYYYNKSRDFKENYDLIYEGGRYYYRKKKSKQETPKHQNGGSVIELTKESVKELVDPSTIPEFQNGGSINVIPDGALHARKHNMDMEGITEKGIPVVDNNGEQQAEVEKEELILRLEVTQKLEELEKKYYNEESSQKEKDEYALEAGKVLVEELLHNTVDNTEKLL